MTNRTAEIAKARNADTRIAAAWTSYHEVNDKGLALVKAAAKSEKALRQYSPAMRDRIEARIAHQRAEAELIFAEAKPLREAAIALDAELYEGWTRFYLVQHIHNTQHCPSFRPTTRVGWLPDVSGLTEAEAVAEHGATLCTICFPTAPVELTTAKVADDICPGSGQAFDKEHLTGRERAHYSPRGTCATCGQNVGLTARFSGKVRKHKRP
jgi:hypothetical protein